MITSADYEIGTIVEMKKPHPCGSKNWQVLRIGADIKLKCLGCDHVVMVPRTKFHKMVKKIVDAL